MKRKHGVIGILCLAASVGVAHGEDLFVFTSGSDTLKFTLPSSPAPSSVNYDSFYTNEVSTFDAVDYDGLTVFYLSGYGGGVGLSLYGPKAPGGYY